MKVLLASVAALLLSYAFFTIGNGLVVTLIGVRGYIEGMGTATLGVVMSAYYAGLLIGALQVPRLLKRVGYIRAFSALVALLTIAALSYILIIQPIVWFFLRIISGIAMGGLFVITESWLNEKADNQRRGRLLATYALVGHISVATGQLLLYVGDTSQHALFIYAAIFCCTAMLPLLMTRSIAPHVEEQMIKVKFLELYQTSPLGFLGVMVAGIGSASFYSLSSLFVVKSGLGENFLPLFICMAILGGMCFQIPIGRWSDKIDRRFMLLLICFVAAGSSLLLFFSANLNLGKTLLLLLVFFFGGSSLLLYSVASAHANDFASTETRTQLAGALITSFGLGATSGPFIGGQFMSHLGAPALFLFLSIIFVSLAVFTLYRMGIRKTVAFEARTPILPASSILPQEILFEAEPSFNAEEEEDNKQNEENVQ